MNLSILFSFLSLALYHYGYEPWAGAAGLVGGLLYLMAYRRRRELLAIGAIGAAVLYATRFAPELSLAGFLRIGVAWSMAIVALFVVLLLVTLVMKAIGK